MLATRDKFNKWVEFFQGGGEFEYYPFEYIGLFQFKRAEDESVRGKIVSNLPPILYPLHDILYRAAVRIRVEAEKALTK